MSRMISPYHERADDACVAAFPVCCTTTPQDICLLPATSVADEISTCCHLVAPNLSLNLAEVTTKKHELSPQTASGSARRTGFHGSVVNEYGAACKGQNVAASYALRRNPCMTAFVFVTTWRKLQTPGNAEEHKKQETHTINPIGPTDKPHRPSTKHYRLCVVSRSVDLPCSTVTTT